MNRVFKLVFALIFLSSGIVMAQPDSLVTYTGTVLNLRTENPVPGVRVSYKKLPYESEMGDIKTDANGQFTVYFRAQEQYSFAIEGESFIKVSEIINPLEGANEQLVVERTFRLSEGGVGSVLKLENLKFGLGEATILPESYGELDNLVKMLSNTPNMTIRLEGHTDYVGNPSANLNLSQMRVDEVKKYIVGKGVADERVETKAFGGSQPIVRSNSSQERAVNRRVEVRILSDGSTN
jgi:OOP family OmpA-OmpF porin